MKKMNIVFLIDNEDKWGTLLAHIANVKARTEQVDKIAVVAISSPILSCLKSTADTPRAQSLAELSTQNVGFYLCGNTLKRYGITPEMLLPFITVAPEGGLIKVLELEEQGYRLLQ